MNDKPIQENFPGYFDKKDAVYPFEGTLIEDDSEEGFPEPLNLSAFYKEGDNGSPPLKAAENQSIFATAMLDNAVTRDEEASEDDVEVKKDEIGAENDAKIKKMSPEEIAKLCEEISECLNPSSIEYLRNRAKSKGNEGCKEVKAEIPKDKTAVNVSVELPKKIVSSFRKAQLKAQAEGKPKDNPEKISKDPPEVTKEEHEDASTLSEASVKGLELFHLDNNGDISEENAAHSRLALNAIQMDLASKAYGLTATRHQTAWYSVFDKCCTSSANETDELNTKAVENIEKIKNLYLELIQVTPDKTKVEFGTDINPASDGAWMLVPIRRVLDAIHVDNRSPTADDLEIVQLTLLFTVIFQRRQSTLMFMFGNPSAALILMSEVFLIGPEVYRDDLVEKCITVLIDEYFLPAAEQKKLSFTTTTPIAGLDAFLPFFYELLTAYQNGYGSANLERILFIMACMNSIHDNTLLLLHNMWQPDSQVIRMCTISIVTIKPMITYIVNARKQIGFYIGRDIFLQYVQLLKLYAGSIINGQITKSRNPGCYQLAITEIMEFLHFWRNKYGSDAQADLVFDGLKRILETEPAFKN